MNILSIQSSVAYGHVGNSAAVFPLQRMGFEVWPVNTVHFSNHTGYGAWRGPVLAAEDVAGVIRGVEDRGVLPSCDAVLSGYMGDASLGGVIVGAAGRVKELNPNALYCCDPVMGDEGRGFFVRPGIPEFVKEVAVPAADVITPNHFELEYLTKKPDHAAAQGGVYFAIHNLAMQGTFEREILPKVGIPPEHFQHVRGVALDGRVNFLKTGAEFATIIGTHSPTQAKRIQQLDRGYGLEETFSRRKKDDGEGSVGARVQLRHAFPACRSRNDGGA